MPEYEEFSEKSKSEWCCATRIWLIVAGVLFFGIVLIGMGIVLLVEVGDFQAMNCWDDRVVKPTNYFSLNELVGQIPKSRAEAYTSAPPTIPKKFKIEEEHFCEGKDFDLISYVFSEADDFDGRYFVRQTWANQSQSLGFIFILGEVEDRKVAQKIKEESRDFGDIVQGEYTDDLELGTYKALNALYWIAKNCHEVKWVAHFDINILLNPMKLMKLIDEKSNDVDEIFCKVFESNVVHRPENIRKSNEKWIVERDEYPCETYPPYCSGKGWITSGGNVMSLLAAASEVNFLWLHDVYVTGHLARQVGLKHTMIQTVDSHAVEPDAINATVFWLRLQGNKMDEWEKIIGFYRN